VEGTIGEKRRKARKQKKSIPFKWAKLHAEKGICMGGGQDRSRESLPVRQKTSREEVRRRGKGPRAEKGGEGSRKKCRKSPIGDSGFARLLKKGKSFSLVDMGIPPGGG